MPTSNSSPSAAMPSALAKSARMSLPTSSERANRRGMIASRPNTSDQMRSISSKSTGSSSSDSVSDELLRRRVL